MSNIAGSTILITGGASGIGRLMALEIARMGGTLAIWDINKENLDKTVEELKAIGRPAYGYICNVADKNEVKKVAQKVKDEVGPVDILVNNAGVVSGKRLLDLPEELIERSFGVNVLAHFWTCKAFLPQMIARNHGHVVTVASSAGLIGVSKMTDYCSSKWAAVGFNESLRMELNDSAPGVKTTVVCPYYIDTGMFEGVKTRFSFLLPILKEGAVAHRIVKAIEKNDPMVAMPPLVHIVPITRALPVALFDKVADLLGINASMDEFTGREGGH
jgi:all-trans-retinol dehydrogenase (NAD+)